LGDSGIAAYCVLGLCHFQHALSFGNDTLGRDSKLDTIHPLQAGFSLEVSMGFADYSYTSWVYNLDIVNAIKNLCNLYASKWVTGLVAIGIVFGMATGMGISC
jgi:hypothetical protein